MFKTNSVVNLLISANDYNVTVTSSFSLFACQNTKIYYVLSIHTIVTIVIFEIKKKSMIKDWFSWQSHATSTVEVIIQNPTRLKLKNIKKKRK